MRMRQFILALTFVSLMPFPLFAASRSEAKSHIEAARKAMEPIEGNEELKPHIPYRNYYDARVYLDTAQYQFSEERDYSNASYFAVMALVETETTLAIARTRLAQHRKLQVERDIFKEMSDASNLRSRLRGALVSSGLYKAGGPYRRVFLDSQLFTRGSFQLSEEGTALLGKIASVMALAPRSTLTVIGHTRYADIGNQMSSMKAGAVAEHIKSLRGIAPPGSPPRGPAIPRKRPSAEKCGSPTELRSESTACRGAGGNVKYYHPRRGPSVVC